MDALGYYNTTKYVISDIKFSELYDRWSEEHFQNIVPSAVRTWKSDYNHSTPLHNMKMSDIWNNLQFPFVDMVLIGIYTGFRPQELAILELDNVDLDNQTIKGGIKTKEKSR